MKYLLFSLITVAVVFVMVELRRALRAYLRFRGKMLVSCPETDRPAAVRVAAAKAAWEAIVGNRELRLSECSRWRIDLRRGERFPVPAVRGSAGPPHPSVVPPATEKWNASPTCGPKMFIRYAKLSEPDPCW